MPSTRLIHPKAIDDLFLYRISHLLATAGAPVIRLCEGEFGITRREWRILALLAQEKCLLSSELAVRAQLDRARTSRAVTGLVRKKLLSRVTRAGDRRAATLALTESGLALYAALFPRVLAINHELLSVLGEAGLADLDAALVSLQARADALAQARDGLMGPKANRRRGGRNRDPAA